MNKYKNTDIQNVFVDTEDNVFIIMFNDHDTWVEMHNSRNVKKYCRIISSAEAFLVNIFNPTHSENELKRLLREEFSKDEVIYIEQGITRDPENDYFEIDECIKKLTDTIYLDECLDVYIVEGVGFEDLYCYVFGQQRKIYADKIDGLLKVRNMVKNEYANLLANENYNIQDSIQNIYKSLEIEKD